VLQCAICCLATEQQFARLIPAASIQPKYPQNLDILFGNYKRFSEFTRREWQNDICVRHTRNRLASHTQLTRNIHETHTQHTQRTRNTQATLCGRELSVQAAAQFYNDVHNQGRRELNGLHALPAVLFLHLSVERMLFLLYMSLM